MDVSLSLLALPDSGAKDAGTQDKVDALRVALAAYETRKARSITEPTEARLKQKADIHRAAIVHLNAATNGRNALVALCKGLVNFSQGDFDGALAQIAQIGKTQNNLVGILTRVGLALDDATAA